MKKLYIILIIFTCLFNNSCGYSIDQDILVNSDTIYTITTRVMTHGGAGPIVYSNQLNIKIKNVDSITSKERQKAKYFINQLKSIK